VSRAAAPLVHTTNLEAALFIRVRQRESLAPRAVTALGPVGEVLSSIARSPYRIFSCSNSSSRATCIRMRRCKCSLHSRLERRDRSANLIDFGGSNSSSMHLLPEDSERHRTRQRCEKLESIECLVGVRMICVGAGVERREPAVNTGAAGIGDTLQLARIRMPWTAAAAHSAHAITPQHAHGKS
jgi:hypothetical protein